MEANLSLSTTCFGKWYSREEYHRGELLVGEAESDNLVCSDCSASSVLLEFLAQGSKYLVDCLSDPDDCRMMGLFCLPS